MSNYPYPELKEKARRISSILQYSEETAAQRFGEKIAQCGNGLASCNLFRVCPMCSKTRSDNYNSEFRKLAEHIRLGQLDGREMLFLSATIAEQPIEKQKNISTFVKSKMKSLLHSKDFRAVTGSLWHYEVKPSESDKGRLATARLHMMIFVPAGFENGAEDRKRWAVFWGEPHKRKKEKTGNGEYEEEDFKCECKLDAGDMLPLNPDTAKPEIFSGCVKPVDLSDADESWLIEYSIQMRHVHFIGTSGEIKRWHRINKAN
jgi:hypothetical protein